MLGVIIFEALGARWQLFLGNAAQCAIEEHYQKGFFAVVADAMPDVPADVALAIVSAEQAGAPLAPDFAERAASALRGIRLSVLRDIAWHGLQRHHPGTTLGQVSDLIDDLGRDAFADVIGRAIRAAQGGGVDAAPGNAPVAKRKRATSARPRPG